MSQMHDILLFKLDANDVVKHPNADSLSIVDVDGEDVVSRTTDLEIGRLYIYFPIETLLDVSNPAFSFLKPNHNGLHRLKAVRLRGVFSKGLLIKAETLTCPSGIYFEFDAEMNSVPAQDTCWDDVYLLKEMGTGSKVTINDILKYEYYDDENISGPSRPGCKVFGGEDIKGPSVPKYDIESFKKYESYIKDDEIVVLTEKIHGANFRSVYKIKPTSQDNDAENAGEFFVGSRGRWLKRPGHCVNIDDNGVEHHWESRSSWWDVAIKYDLENKLKAYPNMVFFGEMYGQVQDLKYGLNCADLIFFDIFDMESNRFLDYHIFNAICLNLNLPTVPVIEFGQFGNLKDDMQLCAEGDSILQHMNNPNDKAHCREGLVLKPLVEREARGLGRVIMKLHGQGYLTRK